MVHGAKALWRLLDRYRLPLPVVKHDTMIAAYLLHTAQKDYSLPLSLSAEHGGAAFPSPTAYDVYALFLRQQKRLEVRGLQALLRGLWSSRSPACCLIWNGWAFWWMRACSVS